MRQDIVAEWMERLLIAHAQHKLDVILVRQNNGFRLVHVPMDLQNIGELWIGTGRAVEGLASRRNIRAIDAGLMFCFYLTCGLLLLGFLNESLFVEMVVIRGNDYRKLEVRQHAKDRRGLAPIV